MAASGVPIERHWQRPPSAHHGACRTPHTIRGSVRCDVDCLSVQNVTRKRENKVYSIRAPRNASPPHHDRDSAPDASECPMNRTYDGRVEGHHASMRLEAWKGRPPPSMETPWCSLALRQSLEARALPRHAPRQLKTQLQAYCARVA